MKSNAKLKIIILIALGILFAFTPRITINPSFITGNSDVTNLDPKNLLISAVSGNIHIVGNSGWINAETIGICTGSGIYSDPYVIKDLEIDGGGSGSCIFIENSNVFFKIENCTVYNSGLQGAGIKLYNTNNSQLIKNNCSSNYIGILLRYSYNNTISGNSVDSGLFLNFSDNAGIFLYFSDNNTIANNSLYWGRSGISLFYCRNITISKNKMNDCGLELYGYLPLDNINVDSSNLVNGKPVYFYYNQINLGSDNFTDAGQVILYDCHDSSIENLNTSYGSTGVSLYYSSNNNITGNIANHNKNDGICLSKSDNNNIWENTLDYNFDCGIDLYRSYNNIISTNNASYNLEGISSWICSRNNISGNNFNANRLSGLILYDSNYNNISGNIANNNIQYGIHLLSSDYNIISGNILSGNSKCIVEMDCEGNIFENNDCTLLPITPSLNYLPIILIIFIPLVGFCVFIIYLNRKRFKRPQKDLE